MLARVSGGLQEVSDDGPIRCTYCGNDAAGPCARCRAPVCGDCCTLTEGGARTWAVCLDCDRKGGKSLSGAWGGLLRFVLGILAVLALAVLLLSRCQGAGGQ